MSINSDDLVAGLLDHQARVNSAIDNTVDEFTVVEELFNNLNEKLGTASDTHAQTTYTIPHHWTDGQSFWDFVEYGAETAARWSCCSEGIGFTHTWGDGETWGHG